VNCGVNRPAPDPVQAGRHGAWSRSIVPGAAWTCLAGKPVVLVDQDQIEIGLQRLRIHIHGEAAVVAAPSPLPVCASTFKRLAAGRP